MEVDIVPELYGKIRKDFDEAVEADEMLSRIYAKIEKGTATHMETQHYAQRIGECAAEAIKKNLTEGILPDGKLYYNIAERTIQPTLEHNHELVNQVASQIQESLNAAAGLGIKPITPEMDAERVERVVNAAVYAEDFGAMQNELAEAIINTTQSFADDFIRENAEFQARAGLSPKITRISTGKCCDWCDHLAGTYEYDGELDRAVFSRHKYCRCVVTYNPGDGRRQNVHTKKWESQEAKKIERRKTVGIEYDVDTSKYSHTSGGILLAKRVVERRAPTRAEPFEVVDVITAKGEVNRVLYDEEGYQMLRVHTSDHGNSSDHPFGAHKHIVRWKNGRYEKVGRDIYLLSEKDRKENSDIL